MDLLFRNPYTSSRALVESIGTSLPTANRIIERFASVGVVREVSGRRRNRLYCADGISEMLRRSRGPQMHMAMYGGILMTPSTTFSCAGWTT